jgi:CheY-like chemotaxis protein
MVAPAIPISSIGKRRVVVVDDEVVIARSLKAFLNHAGFDAHAMFGGQELVDSLETLRPDVLITDVNMPGMTGIEAAIITRNRFPNCKILLVSAQAATSSLLMKAREQGHEFELLGKPLHFPDLLAKLTN